MPWFTLHRNYSLSTTAGHVIGFKKGEQTWVPPACVASAVSIGAQPVEITTETDVLPQDDTKQPILTPEQKQAKFFDAFEKLVLRSQRGDFTASNLPHIGKIEGLVGFPVSAVERDEYWTKYNESKIESN